MTDARVTQEVLEQWTNVRADARATTVLIEMWAPGGTTTPLAVATLVALEMWAPTGLTPSATAQARAWILV